MYHANIFIIISLSYNIYFHHAIRTYHAIYIHLACNLHLSFNVYINQLLLGLLNIEILILSVVSAEVFITQITSKMYWPRANAIYNLIKASYNNIFVQPLIETTKIN